MTTIVADGLVFASWLFLVSAGLTLIYGVLRILNIAHGSLYALGAYAGASLVIVYSQREAWPYGTFFLLPLAAVVVGAVTGPVMERGVLRWMYGRDQVLQLLVTFALFLILEDAVKLIWGVSPYYAFQPYTLLGEIHLADVVYPGYSMLLVGVAACAAVGLWLFTSRSRLGRLVVAVIHDPEMSTAMGVNLPRVYVLTFSLGASLAALGGAFTAPMISVVPGIAVEVIVVAFAVVVIGGLGSLEGAVAGALLIGLVRSAAVHLFPALELFAIYLVMAAVLLVRPHGLFARPEARRI
ncbi:MAG: branched-chain amino acid ABC transporter permease [Armatimonadota bacterium]|nr:branched-chain amino acid ABC transporter permease [Armatimonadota bacterium]MDR5697772.1 branched-chain amino acid ABC transporter permease [Armatimonadota bacterium]